MCVHGDAGAGTAAGPVQVIAALTPDQRLALLEEQLAIAASSGALQRAREQKQAAIDAMWASDAGTAPSTASS